MAQILLADNQANNSFTQNLLKDKHEFVVATSMGKAATALKSEVFDLIIIDLGFDESRMFEAMQLVKTISKNADKPVICISTGSAKIQRPLLDSVDFTARAMGAWMFLDVNDYNQTQSQKSELLRVIDRCLLSYARKETSRARLDLHQQRIEIHRLRSNIEHAEWSNDYEERLVELRKKLAALLVNVCDLSIGTFSHQEEIDELRGQHDFVSDSVVSAEDVATRSERKQALNELHHAVDEFEISEREDLAREKRAQKATKPKTQPQK